MFGLYFELFQQDDKLIRVQSVLRGGQFSTLVEPMDVLVSINGTDCSALSVEEAMNLALALQCAGPMGGNVHFLFQKVDMDDSILVEVTRLASEGQDIQVAMMRRVVEVMKDREFSNIEALKKERHLPGGAGWWIKTLDSINEVKSWANKGYIFDETVAKLNGDIQALQEKLEATELKLQSFQNLSKMRETMIVQLNQEMHRKEVEYTSKIRQLEGVIEDKQEEIEEKMEEIEQKNEEIAEKERVIDFLRDEVSQLEEQIQSLEERLHETEDILESEKRQKHQLERDQGVAAALFLDVDPSIATNSDKRRLVQHLLHLDVLNALGVREDRIEVCGSRPSEHDHGVEVDLQIVPLSFHDENEDHDGRTAQQLIDELMHQIVDANSRLRKGEYGRLVRATHLIHKHEIIRYMRQQLLEAYGVPLEIEDPSEHHILGVGLRQDARPVAKTPTNVARPPTRTQLSSKNLKISIHDTHPPPKPIHAPKPRMSSKGRGRRASITSYPIASVRGQSAQNSPRGSVVASKNSRDPSPMRSQQLAASPTQAVAGSDTNKSFDGMTNGTNGGTNTSNQAYRKRASLVSGRGSPLASRKSSARGSIPSAAGFVPELDHRSTDSPGTSRSQASPRPDLISQFVGALGFGAPSPRSGHVSGQSSPLAQQWKRPSTPDAVPVQNWKRPSTPDAMAREAPLPPPPPRAEDPVPVEEPPPPGVQTQAARAAVSFGKALPPSPPQRGTLTAAVATPPEPQPVLQRSGSPPVPAVTVNDPIRTTYTSPAQLAGRIVPLPTPTAGHRPLYGGTISSSVQRMVDVDVSGWDVPQELSRRAEAPSAAARERSPEAIAAAASASFLNQGGGRTLYTPPAHVPSPIATSQQLADVTLQSGGHVAVRHIPLPSSESPSAPSAAPVLASTYSAAQGVGYTRAPLTSIRNPTLAYSLQPADKRPDAEPGKVWKM